MGHSFGGAWRPRFVTTLCMLAVWLVLPGSRFQPASLTVLSTNATKAVVEALAPQVEQATKRKLVFSFAPSAELKTRIEKGEPFDVAILTSALIDDLVAQSNVAAGTRATIARAGAGVAIRKGASRPDISTSEAFKRTLLEAKSIAKSTSRARATV